MLKGPGLALRYAFAISKLLLIILFYYEASLVVGFSGKTCFCRFEEAFKRYNYGDYFCMEKIGDVYPNLIMVKFVYVCLIVF